MLSPMMTVIVLAVLWLIVVVPMIFRRHDEGARERSVARFGRTMRALGRRAHAPRENTEVFVPATRPAPAQRAVSTRRPVPAAEEALMYPVEHDEMSEARAAMMVRRRRSLGVLGMGTAVLVPTALITGGLVWLIAAPFALGLAGYLLFLRSQAQKDRDRRYLRQQRASRRRVVRGRDVTMRAEPPTAAPEHAESVVRIDDEDLELQNLDTVDLTGLYSEQLSEPVVQRRAS